MKIDNNFRDWLELATERATVIMCDGRKAELVSVQQNTGTCKIKMLSKHLLCDVRQIEYVMVAGWKVPMQPWPLRDGPGTHQPTRTSKRWYRPKPIS